MKLFLIALIWITSLTHANECLNYFSSVVITRAEDLSAAEYDNLESMARLELQTRTLTDPQLRSSGLAELDGFLDEMVQNGIDLRVYYEVRDDIAANLTSKTTFLLQKIEQQQENLDLQIQAQEQLGRDLLTEFKCSDLNEVLLRVLITHRKHRKRVVKTIFNNLVLSRKIYLDALINETASEGDIYITGILLDHGANIQKKDVLGNSLLHLAPSRYTNAMLKFLISRGADVNATNRDGRTPLHEAAKKGNLRASKILLDSRANINAQDNDGNTPLHIALIRGRSILAILLSTYGADKNILNHKGETPRQAAKAWIRELRSSPHQAANTNTLKSLFTQAKDFIKKLTPQSKTDPKNKNP